MARLAALTETLRAPGRDPEAGLTKSQGLLEAALKLTLERPVSWTVWVAETVLPAVTVKLRDWGAAVREAPERVMVTGTASWVPSERLEIWMVPE